jgi:ribosome-binding protein aMBF1 (putative translation factor)
VSPVIFNMPGAYHRRYSGTRGGNVAKTGEITEQERLRRRAGLSVTELARRAGFSHAYVSRVEAGHLRPSARYRQAVAAVLGVPEGVVFPEAAS